MNSWTQTRVIAEDLALALTSAFLVMIVPLLEFLSPEAPYYLALSRVDYIAILADIGVFTALLFAAMRLLRRFRRPALALGARLAYLCLLAIPVFGLRSAIARVILPVAPSLPAATSSVTVLALLVTSAGIALVVLGERGHRLFRLIKVAVLCLTPLAVVRTSALVPSALASTTASQDRSISASARTERTVGQRVAVVVFDELDEHATLDNPFVLRRMPALARLVSQSTRATNAYPPANQTLFSVPAMLTGHRVLNAHIADGRTLQLTVSGRTTAVPLERAETVFSDARQLGARVSVIGSYLPYCRLESLANEQCSFFPLSLAIDRAEAGLLERMATKFVAGFPILRKRTYISRFRALRTAATRDIADSRFDLVYIHVLLPHKPWIYDSRAGRLDAVELSESGYFANLELADHFLGELRAAMEESGTWQNTTLVVTSDHFWRRARVVTGDESHRVPLLLHFAGESRGSRIEMPLNLLVVREMVSAIMRKEVRNPSTAESWFSKHCHPTAYFPSSLSARCGDSTFVDATALQAEQD